jgi:predicted CXXCH cytochrome family protein
MKSNRTIKYSITLLLVLYLCLGLSSTLSSGAFAVSFFESAHGNKNSMPKGCGSCHVGHGKPQTPMLPAPEEALCYQCHGGAANSQKAKKENRLGTAAELPDISKEFQKPSHHPVEIRGAHNPREMVDAAVPILERHSECVDCHHEHRTERKTPRLRVDASLRKRSSFDNADPEYELCYRCHGRGSFTAPLAETTDPENEFNVGNRSYHPVEAQGTNNQVPSLILPYTPQSLINCTDCHGNDNPSGPSGPHGSIYSPILVRNFNQRDDSMESEYQYSLCYGCHSRSNILSNQSFSEHKRHIVDEKTSCHTCHDSHGSRSNAHLIVFDSEVVRPSSIGRLEYVDTGNQAGQCYLSCHGKDHNPLSYP